MTKKYSVLMSLYQKENPVWFATSLESMINQTIVPDEIVIVLDGPLTTLLNDLVRDYKNKYPDLIKVVPLSQNVGLGKALDIGIQHCKNELIARMDTDDISLLVRCEKQLELFEQFPELSIVGTNVDEFYDTPEKIVSSRVVPSNYDDIVKFMRRRSPFNHPTVMYKKSAVIGSGGYGNLKRKQDLDLFSRMINYGYKAKNINQSLVLFRSNESNFKRRKSWNYVKSYIDVQYKIWRRGHCSLKDFSYVTAGQLTMFLAPMPMLKKLSSKYLRK